jgi:hypothetical protein
MKDDVVEIESNMIASGKDRVKNESGESERRKQKEQVGTSGTNKNQEDKIEEMSIELLNIYQINWLGWRLREEDLIT